MQVREATSLDNALLCELIATIGIASGSEFTLDRSPDFWALLRHRGESRTFLAHTRTGAAAGLVTALWRTARFEGAPVRVGEIVDLRVAPGARNSRAAYLLLDAACQALRDAQTDWITCLIGDQNNAAKALVQRGGRWPRLVPLTQYASVHYPAWRLGCYPKGVIEVTATQQDAVSRLWQHASAGQQLAPVEPWSTTHTRAWSLESATQPTGIVVSDLDVERRIRVTRYDRSNLPLVVGSRVVAALKRGSPLPKPPGTLRMWATRCVHAPHEPAAVGELVRAALHAAANCGVHVLQVNVAANSATFQALPRLPRAVFLSTLYGLPWALNGAQTWRNNLAETFCSDIALI